MNRIRNYLISILILAFVAVTVFLSKSCRKDPENMVTENKPGLKGEASDDSLKYNPTWTFSSHGNASHNYNVVFPQDSVNRLEIIMTPDAWAKIRANMKILFGYDFGTKGTPPGGMQNAEPDYVDVLVRFRNKQWKNTGYRLKGNSSLKSAWGSGNYKMPFRLNFDKFEEIFPAIKNQHFYGFKELTFSPGFKDPTLIREKLASDVFRMGGIPSARTAFYRVYVDFGDGLKYCGVYTAVEIPEDNMIKEQFGEEDGNIYKPLSRFSTFIIGEFEKKNNETLADYSDVKSFISALNSTVRLTNKLLWRSNLETTFNVDHFLKYLAVNNAIVNWDSYGVIAHNFYLYNHPSKKLTWIPWDHNEAFLGNPGVTGTSQGSGTNPADKSLSLTMNEVGSSWPLLRFIADDSIYFQKYKVNIKSFNNQVLSQKPILDLIDKYSNLIIPFVVGTNGEQANATYIPNNFSFANGKAILKNHIESRKKLIDGF